jgi:hypothetical protein
MKKSATAGRRATIAMPQQRAVSNTIGDVYVSDFLEEILDAGTERALTRENCLAAAHGLPAEIAEQARYYGGKCMGYPAIWMLRHALGLDRQHLIDATKACRASVFLSLTASIVDDWIDRDEPVTIAPASLFYMLMVRGLGASQSGTLARDLVAEKLQEVIEQLLLVERSAHFGAQKKLEICAGIAGDSGIKIGNFHELIAAEFCAHLSLQADATEALRRLANRFGRWCALLDDIIDVRSDIAAGDWASLPAARLLSGCNGEVSPFATVSPDAELRLILIAEQQLKELAAAAGEAGFMGLARAIECAHDRLPEHFAALMAVRRRSHPA